MYYYIILIILLLIFVNIKKWIHLLIIKSVMYDIKSNPEKTGSI